MVRAVMRRTGDGQAVQAEGLVIDESRYSSALYDRSLALTAVEFRLLQILAANPGRIYSRQQLMDHIYHDQRFVSDRNIDSHIKRLRKKIAAVGACEEIIHSVYSVGYKFEMPMEPVRSLLIPKG